MQNAIHSIIFKKKQIKEIEDNILLNKPYETCAILSGIKKDSELIVIKMQFMENKDKSEIKFRIDEDRLFKIYTNTESEKLSVIGIFHSHPSPPVPSKTDMKYMEINPIPWIIKSTTTNDIRCFIYREYEKYQEISIKIMD